MDAQRGQQLIDTTTQSVADIVAVVNVPLASQGLEVRETPGRGYGLFATRAFFKGQTLTEYGGVYHKPCGDELRGDYVLAVKVKHCAWDAERSFYAHHGGRWINEPPLGQMWRVNVEGRYTGKRYYFVAARDLAAGEELYLNYGDDYEAPWRLAAILRRSDRAELARALETAQRVLSDVKQWAATVASRAERGRAEYELRHAAEDVATLQNALRRLGDVRCALCQAPAQMIEAYAAPGQSVRLCFCDVACQLDFYSNEK
jgi:hypothetical protein